MLSARSVKDPDQKVTSQKSRESRMIIGQHHRGMILSLTERSNAQSGGYG
jgi:hypothetical protein